MELLKEIPGCRISRCIYRGPRSDVYRAELAGGAPVVVKRLRAEYPPVQEVTRYKHDFELTKNPPGPGVARSLSLHKVAASLAIVMEDIGGESLAALLKNTRFPIPDILDLALDLAGILSEIHAAGIVHRNLSPSAIVLNPRTRQVQLIDFGMASVLTRERVEITTPALLGGDLRYLSPEQTGRTSYSIDYRADYYSLGIVIYELLTGHPPFCAGDPLDLVFCHLAREPEPPHLRNSAAPSDLSAVVLKLLAKCPDDRYQSARGIRLDLEACRRGLGHTPPLDSFVPGAHDAPERLRIPQQLYGRDREIEIILQSFARCSQGGRELLLVSGFSGIGKTSLVRETYKPITGSKGFFAAGKFDQLQRSVPYSALVEAFQSLIRQILSESQDSLAAWGAKIQQAIHPNGRLLTDVIPGLELVVGEQPPAEDLPPAEAQNRFDLVFLAFMRTFCDTGHPLILFLDDLQWADMASLRLLESALTGRQTKALMVIGAFRDNEVSPSHPLTLAIERLRSAGETATTVALGPLRREDVALLISDAIGTPAANIASLVDLVIAKTGGNPFFLIQFLRTLFEEGLLHYDHAHSLWRWDIARIEALGITDNVVDLLIGKIGKLPEPARQVVSLAACLGNSFDLATLSTIHGKSPAATFHDLLPALREDLVVSTSGIEISEEDVLAAQVVMVRFRFLHDRVQQAAYTMTPKEMQPAVHLRIGRLLSAGGMEREASGKRLFMIADHLNLGLQLIEDRSQLVKLAAVDLQAARRAKEATAYGAALQYLVAGMERLPEDIWSRDYSLALNLYRERASLEYLNGNFEASRSFIGHAVSRANSPVERAELLHMLIVQHTLAAEYPEAISVARKALSLVGINLPEEEYEAARDAGMAEVDRLLAGRSFSSLIGLPPMTDPAKRVAMKLLTSMGPPCYRSHQRLWAVIVAKEMTLCLQYGDVAAATYTYPSYGGLLGYVRNHFQDCEVLARLSFALADKYPSASDKSVAHLMVGASLDHWFRHLREAEEDYRLAYQIGLDSGNLQYSVYAFGHLMYCRFYRGKNLDEQVLDLPGYIAFSRKRRNQWGIDLMTGIRIILHNLTARTPDIAAFTDSETAEEELLHRCLGNGNVQVLCIYHILKIQVLFLHGCIEQAAAASAEANQRLIAVATQGLLPAAEHRFFDCLLQAELYRRSPAKDQAGHLERVQSAVKQLHLWAENCPPNFLHKALLAEAELAGLTASCWQAFLLYDRAIEAAAADGFVQHEALANELAARFWIRQGKEEFAVRHLRNAHYGYGLWGAHAKVRLLEREFPQYLRTERGAEAGTQADVLASLDLRAVIRASHAISGALRQDDLAARLMELVMESAGAGRGFLLVPWNEDFHVVRRIVPNTPAAFDPLPLSECKELSAAAVRFVGRTREHLLIDSSSKLGFLSTDEYMRRAAPRSILCLPIQSQGKLSAILYLENTLSDSAFSPERVEVLRILAAQAAISFENSRYYQELESLVSERTRELAEANERLKREMEHRSRMEAHLLEIQKVESIGILAGGIAHDFNNSLTVINGYSSLLLAKLAPHDPLRAQVAEILRAGEHSASLTQQLLAYSRKQVIEPKAIDVNDVVAGVKAMLRPLIGEAIELAVTPGPALSPVLADPNQLRQVLMNLATNARDAMPDGGHLLIETANAYFDESYCADHPEVKPGHYAVLSVTDTGAGMSRETVSKMFDPFFTTKPVGRGTGLGLSTVYGIVRQMGGWIWVYSEPGKGSTFKICFPAISPPAEQLDPVPVPEDPLFGTGTVLVAEDQPEVRQLTAMVLKRYGYHVLEAANGREALLRCESYPDPIHLLVTDVMMPEMTGRQLVERLAQVRPGLSVLYVSGYTANVIARQNVLDGGAAFLSKPFTPVQLASKVREIIGSI